VGPEERGRSYLRCIRVPCMNLLWLNVELAMALPSAICHAKSQSDKLRVMSEKSSSDRSGRLNTWLGRWHPRDLEIIHEGVKI